MDRQQIGANDLDAVLPQLPLVSIVVTHMNYSGHIEDALRSVAGQTYERWECVVVDDGSDEVHRERLRAVIAKLNSPRIRLLCLDENVGQVPAFFAGLDVTSGPFVCPLDPDDRYAGTFLEECVATHLNPIVSAPLLSTSQALITEYGQLTGSYNGYMQRHLVRTDGVTFIPDVLPTDPVFFPAVQDGWLWTSTSSMMFRRAALDYMRPRKTLSYRGDLDTYLAPSAHRLGGSFLLPRPLVYRTVHADNAYLTERILFTHQSKRKDGAPTNRVQSELDCIEAIEANGGGGYLYRPARIRDATEPRATAPLARESTPPEKARPMTISTDFQQARSDAAFVPSAPLVSIVVPHRNYSGFVRQALQSVLLQTHTRWQCVVVDDASDAEHRERLRQIVDELGSEKIRIHWCDDNIGQIPAILAGVAETQGDFVCALDPDDRYAPTFLEEALRAHLNPAVYCPILSTDEAYFTEHGLISGVVARHTYDLLRTEDEPLTLEQLPARLTFTKASIHGWHWTSTSALMFRRAVFHYLKPDKILPYKGSADAYLANGAHMLGGTLFLSKPLVYRGVHQNNAYLSDRILGLNQNIMRRGGEDRNIECIRDVRAAIIANGGEPMLSKRRKATATKPKAPPTIRQRIKRRAKWVLRQLGLAQSKPN